MYGQTNKSSHAAMRDGRCEYDGDSTFTVTDINVFFLYYTQFLQSEGMLRVINTTHQIYKIKL